MASLSWEVPTPEAAWAWYTPGPHRVTPAIAMPAGIVPTSTTTTFPRTVVRGGKSWNQRRGSVLGARTWGVSVARPCGATGTRSLW